jgi:ribonuclease P protein component
MGRFTFNKAEKLSSEKTIQELFNRGSSFYLHPFKVIYIPNPDQTFGRPQILISVSSRNFPRAVDRNLIKRRIREAYRLQKEILRGESKKGAFAFVYTSKSVLPYAEIRSKLFLVLEKIEKLEIISKEKVRKND